MKKRVIFLSIMFCIIFITIFALVKFTDKSLSELETVEGIIMSIKEDTLTSTSATIIITNNTDIDYLTGHSYRIDKNIDGKWYKIGMKEDMITTMVAIGISSGTSLEDELNWERYYGKLESGRYRIVKDVSKSDSPKNYDVAIEFIIE